MQCICHHGLTIMLQHLSRMESDTLQKSISLFRWISLDRFFATQQPFGVASCAGLFQMRQQEAGVDMLFFIGIDVLMKDCDYTNIIVEYSGRMVNWLNNISVLKVVAARVSELPAWVFFPDVERVEWVNRWKKNYKFSTDYLSYRVVAQLWPTLTQFITHILTTEVSKHDIYFEYIMCINSDNLNGNAVQTNYAWNVQTGQNVCSTDRPDANSTIYIWPNYLHLVK